MESQVDQKANQEFVAELRDCAKVLIEKLEGDKFDEASQLIEQIIASRDRHLFNNVGKLTRGLHTAIRSFNIDSPISQDESLTDASDRLNYVLRLTQDAANKTMDKVEASAPIAMDLGNEARALKAQWQALIRRELSADDFRDLYHRIETFLDQMETGAGALNANLQDIILEQGYQDLTGQVLKKVMDLVAEVEGSLVDLMRIAAQVEEITGIQKPVDNIDAKEPKGSVGEGPQIHADKREDVVSGQDDVDDLLSSLGF
ncbi:protein phosphatase CheZ [Simiduia sp. 21SJ11W-1]|uniref:protein phosphatase CheZ n=1 Tax=Simiduia sp. 21SJ11W-1 TaxID=2909669 RepID=UPI00209CE82E|nr:protein phosphatase CheZ [Simiduia sp. 21SJ11W-1]UTA49505.1 protein phosphatase CheZ [Simiduia sp. 21SJ11W-1]